MDFDSLVLGPCFDVFGAPATFVPAAGPRVAITGLLQKNHRELHWQGETDVITTRPIFTCRFAAIGRLPVEHECFIVDGETWVVREALPDGEGHLKCYLNRATVKK